MTREELIAALEKAEAGSRKLDAAVAAFLAKDDDYTSIEQNFRGYDWCVRYYPGPPGPEYSRVPRYTTSSDAALTLVPDNHTVDMAICPEMGVVTRVYSGPVRENSAGEPTGRGNAPALALCIAALKARA